MRLALRAIAIAQNDSRADFFRPEPIAILDVDASSDVNQGAFP
jgi:hypothetical protein